ncbi:MAG: class I SAM-dependent methyltransferase [Pseudomonadota bacterium]
MSRKSTSQIYDEAAANWQRSEPLLLSDFTARPFMIDWCGDVRGRQVLDLGCGEGYVARQLAGLGAHVCAVDISAQMIAQASVQERQHPLGIDFRVADARSLRRLDLGTFDLVAAVFLFNYLDCASTATVFEHVRQLLRPGGRFVFSVPHPSLAYLRAHEKPFYFDPRGKGYFEGRDHTFEGRLWRRDGVDVPVRCVHKTLGDYFSCLRSAGFERMPEVEELRALPEHIALDPEFFASLNQQPLHLAFRLTASGA